ncbi:hypothetical protein [Spongiimicrobium sp. 3-5]|uniref:hypothetical protein n=1 Tax=Spongiimicrobium sp. 3-5 TaxID=3332596 RepID=UPI00397EB1F8
MSYKLKSLVYFSCFVAASLTYYSMDQDLDSETNTTSLAKVSVNEVSTSNIPRILDTE